MTTAVLVNRIAISRQGQQIYFEINLPSDTESIAGIETGISAFCVADTGIHRVAGDLSMQVDSRANNCYHAQIELALFSQENKVLGFPVPPHDQITDLFTSPYSGSRYSEPERLFVPHCSALYISYKDLIGTAMVSDLVYTITLYIWINRTDL